MIVDRLYTNPLVLYTFNFYALEPTDSFSPFLLIPFCVVRNSSNFLPIFSIISPIKCFYSIICVYISTIYFIICFVFTSFWSSSLCNSCFRFSFFWNNSFLKFSNVSLKLFWSRSGSLYFDTKTTYFLLSKTESILVIDLNWMSLSVYS